jgi:hypothetical protein
MDNARAKTLGGAHEPILQGMHTDGDVALRVTEYVPGGQGSHELATR